MSVLSALSGTRLWKKRLCYGFGYLGDETGGIGTTVLLFFARVVMADQGAEGCRVVFMNLRSFVPADAEPPT